MVALRPQLDYKSSTNCRLCRGLKEHAMTLSDTKQPKGQPLASGDSARPDRVR